MNTNSSAFAVFFWQNIEQMKPLLALDVEQLNDIDKEQLREITLFLEQLESSQQLEFLPVVADLVLELNEDLKSHYVPPQRLSLGTDLNLLNEVWQAVKAEDMILILFCLRLLGGNKLETFLFKYEGSSVFLDLKNLLLKKDEPEDDE